MKSRFLPSLLLLFALLLVFLSGCAHGEESSDQKVALSITSATLPQSGGTVSVKTGMSASLRSASALMSGHIGVFLSGTDYDSRNNVKYTYSSGWSSTDPIYLDEKEASVCAYYPYEYTPVITDASSVTLTSQLYNASEDLCFCPYQTRNSNAPAASFYMKHAYAMMTFHIARTSSYKGACAISAISIANKDIQTGAMLNMTDSTYTAGTTGVVTVDPAVSAIAVDASTSVGVLMVPVSTAMTGDIILTFTVDGVAMSTALPVALNNLTTLDAGSHYTASVSISGTGMAVTHVSLTDWVDISVPEGINTAILADESNCYLLPLGESVYIPVSRARTANAANFTSSWTAGLLWTDNANGVSASGAIASIAYNTDGGYIKVTAGSADGNGVVWIKNASGDIVWSWHIWVTNYNPNAATNGAVYAYNSLTWMDRNLGATTTTPASLTVMGLLYQWGRKDPFPGSSSVYNETNGEYKSISIYDASGTQLTEGAPTGGTGINSTVVPVENNLLNAIKNPMTFYVGTGGTSIGYDWYTATDSRSNQNDALWGGASISAPTAKTVYDPCPYGWRVPAWNSSISPWTGFDTSNPTGTADLYDEYLYFPWYSTVWATGYGRIYNAASNTFYPAQGFRQATNGSFSGMGGSGYYWSASGVDQNGESLIFNSINVTAFLGNRAYGFGVRCVQE